MPLCYINRKAVSYTKLAVVQESRSCHIVHVISTTKKKQCTFAYKEKKHMYMVVVYESLLPMWELFILYGQGNRGVSLGFFCLHACSVESVCHKFLFALKIACCKDF